MTVSISTLAPDWSEVTLPNTGRKFYLNTKTRHCQWEAPLFEILDLNPEESDNYTKSEIKAAWFAKKKGHAAEPPLVREAYETLRHTRSRCEYVHANVASASVMARKTAANLLACMLLSS